MENNHWNNGIIANCDMKHTLNCICIFHNLLTEYKTSFNQHMEDGTELILVQRSVSFLLEKKSKKPGKFMVCFLLMVRLQIISLIADSALSNISQLITFVEIDSFKMRSQKTNNIYWNTYILRI